MGTIGVTYLSEEVKTGGSYTSPAIHYSCVHVYLTPLRIKLVQGAQSGVLAVGSLQRHEPVQVRSVSTEHLHVVVPEIEMSGRSDMSVFSDIATSTFEHRSTAPLQMLTHSKAFSDRRHPDH